MISSVPEDEGGTEKRLSGQQKTWRAPGRGPCTQQRGRGRAGLQGGVTRQRAGGKLGGDAPEAGLRSLDPGRTCPQASHPPDRSSQGPPRSEEREGRPPETTAGGWVARPPSARARARAVPRAHRLVEEPCTAGVEVCLAEARCWGTAAPACADSGGDVGLEEGRIRVLPGDSLDLCPCGRSGHIRSAAHWQCGDGTRLSRLVPMLRHVECDYPAAMCKRGGDALATPPPRGPTAGRGRRA